MSNMSYCRFENTSNALKDCLANLFDTSLSESEKKARAELIKTARAIVTAIEEEGDDERNAEGDELTEDVCETCERPQSECECDDDDIPSCFGTHQVADIG